MTDELGILINQPLVPSTEVTRNKLDMIPLASQDHSLRIVWRHVVYLRNKLHD